MHFQMSYAVMAVCLPFLALLVALVAAIPTYWTLRAFQVDDLARRQLAVAIGVACAVIFIVISSWSLLVLLGVL